MGQDSKIMGIALRDGMFKNIIKNDSNFNDSTVKEVIYATEFGEVEVLFGFEDLNLIEVDEDSTSVHNARVFLSNTDTAEGVMFLDKGILVITDLTFFSAYTRIDGKDTPYTSLVESDTYEDEIAASLIEEDFRLQ